MGIENSSHHIRDVTFREDAATVHTGTAPRTMAAFRRGARKTLGATNIAKTTKAIGDDPARALPIPGINFQPNPRNLIKPSRRRSRCAFAAAQRSVLQVPPADREGEFGEVGDLFV